MRLPWRSVQLRYGRLGTSGQALDKELADGTAAIKQANKLIGEKLAKGYVECVAI